ncbi:hypothetical protein AB8919_05320 [Yersinia enterocolitica]|uniref:hypothetical protein n=1 Tax=Yersinia enterocolitica TaxID=630 RepID=UPI003D01FB7A
MHRIDTPTAQVDKFGAGKNGFTRGNPQTGAQATALDDDYFDAVQEEIVGVIEGAGIALNKANRTQLLTALKKLFLQSGNNLSEIKAAGAPAIAATLSNIGALSTTGTAAAATKLATARKISGVDFDGTKDITLPFINTTDTNIQLTGNLTAQGHITSQGSLISKTNIGADGRCDIVGDLRGGHILSKADVIVGEGQAGGYATINSTGNIAASQWGGGWLSTRTARAFAVFNGVTGAVSGSMNVASVTRNAMGTYTIVFSSAMPGTYAVMVGANGGYSAHLPSVDSKSATAFRLLTPTDSGTEYPLRDLTEVQFVVFSTGI